MVTKYHFLECYSFCNHCTSLTKLIICLYLLVSISVLNQKFWKTLQTFWKLRSGQVLYIIWCAMIKALVVKNSVLHNFGFRKVSPAKQLLIQQVGFVNLRRFFQNRSRAKHWIKNLKSLVRIINGCILISWILYKFVLFFILDILLDALLFTTWSEFFKNKQLTPSFF